MNTKNALNTELTHAEIAANRPIPRSGDPCGDECGGWLQVYASRRIGGSVVRYLACWKCHWKPPNNRQVVDAHAVPRRKRRT
jgi:hypothetical protein